MIVGQIRGVKLSVRDILLVVGVKIVERKWRKVLDYGGMIWYNTLMDKVERIEIDACYNIDCNIGMRLMKEQGLIADWCIGDPPYSIGYTKMTGGGDSLAKRRIYNCAWADEKISKDCIDLMLSVSKQQIIFGGNYYTDILPPTKSWIIWDKRCDNKNRNDFADCELAWCSTGVARVFRYLYQGMLQGDMANKDVRFHETQKPTQLWYLLLNYYTKEGDLILDPFAGSQSLRIACHKLKRHYVGFEKDEDYFKKGTEWFKKETAQISLFD